MNKKNYNLEKQVSNGILAKFRTSVQAYTTKTQIRMSIRNLIFSSLRFLLFNNVNIFIEIVYNVKFIYNMLYR